MEVPGNAQGNVEIGGLMLCAAPLEMIDARNEYYANASQSQTDSVDHKFTGISDPRMPVFSEKKSGVSRGASFGTGN